MGADPRKSRRFITLRLWPMLTALGSALVMLLAFLLPSIQDQWDRYRSRQVVQEYVRLGDRFMDEADYAMAAAAYDKAIELSPTSRLDVEVKRLEARVGRMNAVSDWGDTLDTDLEDVDFAFLLHLRKPDDPRNAMVLNAYATFLAGRGQLAKAGTMLDQAIALSPDDPLVRVNHGNWLDGLGRKAEAEQEYLLACRLDSTNAEARYDLGLLYLEQGDSLRGRKLLREAALLAPADTALRTHGTLDTTPEH